MRAIAFPPRRTTNDSLRCSTASSRSEKFRAASVAVTSFMKSDYQIFLDRVGTALSELVISARLIEELEQALGYPKIRKRITKQESDEFIEVLFRLATTAEDPMPPSSVQSSDPGDDYLVSLVRITVGCPR